MDNDNDTTPDSDTVVRLSDAQCDSVLEAVCAAAAKLAVDHANLPTVKALAQAMAATGIDGNVIGGCDACDIGAHSQLVAEAADLFASTQYDINGDPLVSVCGFCVADHKHEPPEYVEDFDVAEMDRLVREEQAMAAEDAAWGH